MGFNTIDENDAPLYQGPLYEPDTSAQALTPTSSLMTMGDWSQGKAQRFQDLYPGDYSPSGPYQKPPDYIGESAIRNAPMMQPKPSSYEELAPYNPSWLARTFNPGGSRANYLAQAQNYNVKRDLNARQNAVTEGNIYKAIEATDPGQRGPLVKTLERFYGAQGIQMDPLMMDFLKKADEEDLAVAKQTTQMLATELGLSPEETGKLVNGTQAGAVKFFEAFSRIKKQKTDAEKHAVETKKGQLINKLLERSLNPQDGALPSEGTSTLPTYQNAPMPPVGTLQGGQSAALSPQEQSQRSDRRQAFEGMVDEIGQQMGADPHVVQMVKATAAIETNGYDSTATSPKGARGVLQFMPATAQQYGVQDPTDDRQAIAGALKYYTQLNTMFPGKPELQFAGYNAGEGRVQRAGNAVPSIQETQGYVQRGMRQYTSLPGYQGEPIKGAPKEAQATLNALDKSIAQDVQWMENIGPASGVEEINKMYDNRAKLLDAKLKRRESLDKKFNTNVSTDLDDYAKSQAGVPYNQLDPLNKAQIYNGLAQFKREEEAKKKRSDVAIAEPSQIRVAEAANANQIIPDVNKYRDAEGNPAPVGSTRADLKASGLYHQVEPMSDTQVDQAGARKEFVTNLQELANKYGTIATGPIAGRVERFKQMFGISAKDDVTAQRLLLDKIITDKAFTVGGKALTATEFERVVAELPRDTDDPPIFRARLNKALQLATRYAQQHNQAMRENGTFVPKVWDVGEPTLAPTTPKPQTASPSLSEPDAGPTPSGQPKKRPNPLAEASK
jgi:hypothetical protein